MNWQQLALWATLILALAGVVVVCETMLASLGEIRAAHVRYHPHAAAGAP